AVRSWFLAASLAERRDVLVSRLSGRPKSWWRGIDPLLAPHNARERGGQPSRFFFQTRLNQPPSNAPPASRPGRRPLVRLGSTVVPNTLGDRLADRLVGGRGSCRAGFSGGSAGASPSRFLDGLREAAMASDPSAVLQGLLARLAAGDQA